MLQTNTCTHLIINKFTYSEYISSSHFCALTHYVNCVKSQFTKPTSAHYLVNSVHQSNKRPNFCKKNPFSLWKSLYLKFDILKK